MRYRPCTLQVMAQLPVQEPSTCGQSCQKVSGVCLPMRITSTSFLMTKQDIGTPSIMH